MIFFQGTIANDGFSMVLLPPDHHHWMFFCRLTIDIDGFSMVFPNSGTMVNDGFGYKKTKKMRKCDRLHFSTNLRNLQNTLHAPFHPFHFQSIVLICTQHLEFTTWMKTLPSWVLIRIKTPLCVSSFCYHCKLSMVFIGTITIEWNGQRQPLKTMVFQWFWVSQPLVTMVFRWLATIGPTMEWLNTIVEVSLSTNYDQNYFLIIFQYDF